MDARQLQSLRNMGHDDAADEIERLRAELGRCGRDNCIGKCLDGVRNWVTEDARDAAVAAERERCAAVCDDYAKQMLAAYQKRGGQRALDEATGAQVCASGIRAIGAGLGAGAEARCWCEAADEIERLRKDKDAERYRKLRRSFVLAVFAVDREGYPGTEFMGDDLDAAIDRESTGRFTTTFSDENGD